MCILCLFAANLLFVPAAHAAEKPPLSVELSSMSPTVRLGRPMPTVWEINRTAPQLLEGRLEFTIRIGQQVYSRFTTDEQVFHSPNQRLRLLLPPLWVQNHMGELEVDVTWLSQGQRTPLVPQILRLPGNAVHSPGILVGESMRNGGREPQRELMIDLLRLESLGHPFTEKDSSPYSSKQRFQKRDWVQTILASLEAANFPTEPLAYTAYDLVYITPDVFRLLRRSQLDALTIWLRAGGAVYIDPAGVLDVVHLEFLQGLVRRSGRTEPLRLDAKGQLATASDIEREQLLLKVDFGRAVVAGEVAPTDWEPVKTRGEQQREMARFLWRVPRSPHAYGLWNAWELAPEFTPPGSRHPGVISTGDLRNDKTGIHNLLLQALMPQDGQSIPLWFFTLLLSGLVLMMGPGEWFILGKLRLRRFTWLTWPLAMIAATIVTMQVSNAYMRSLDAPRRLTLADIGSGGDVVRTNRFGLLYPSQGGTVDHDVRQAIWMSLYRGGETNTMSNQAGGTPQMVVLSNGQRMWVNGPPSPDMSSGRDTTMFEDHPIEAEGRVPSRATVHERVFQWTASLHRQFELPTEPGPPVLRMEELRPHITWNDPVANGVTGVSPGLQAAVRSSLGPTTMVAVLLPGGELLIDDSRGWWRGSVQVERGFGGRLTVIGMAQSLAPWLVPTVELTTHGASARWPSAPLGSLYSDLAFLSSTRGTLLAVVPGETETLVYRLPLDWFDQADVEEAAP